MAISDDHTVSYTNKTVTHTSGATVYTALAYFQWLAALFAQSAQLDDYYPLVSDTPTVYRFVNGWAFGDSTADIQFLKGGSIESSDGNELWSNLYSIGSQEEGSQIYLIQDGSEIASWWGTGNIDVLLLVKTGGALIDSGNVLAMCRETDYSYDHNTVGLGGGSRNPVGINNAKDLNYYQLEDTGDVKVGLTSVANMDAGSYLYGDTSKATARINYVNSTDGEVYLVMIEDGPFQNGETVYERPTRAGANGTTTTTDTAQSNIIAGYGANVAIDYAGPFSKDLNNGAGATNYDTEVIASGGKDVIDVYQYLKYITRHNSTDTVDTLDGEQYLDAAAGSYTAVKSAPFGTFAGGTLFGARGNWVYGTSSSSFILVNSANAQQSPPNYQKVSCSHASLIGCQIFVAEISAGEIKKDQYTIDIVDSTSVTTTLDIDINKTPVSGSFRVGDTVYTFTSFSGKVFSGVSPDPTGETGNLFVPLLDVLADEATELSDNLIYGSNISLRTVVRKYGFKEYSADTSFTSTGLTFQPILSNDPQAS